MSSFSVYKIQLKHCGVTRDENEREREDAEWVAEIN